jgi:hypothetical protein
MGMTGEKGREAAVCERYSSGEDGEKNKPRGTAVYLQP